MSELHLDSLEIKNFRCFEHLTIEKLGRVNLIVGKNSVGKTCVLEAVNLYANKALPQQLYFTLAARGDVNPQNPDKNLTLAHLASLFWGRDDDIGKSGISVGEVENKDDCITLQRIYCMDDAENPPRLKEIDPNIINQLDGVRHGLRIKQGNKYGRIFRLPLSGALDMQAALSHYSVDICNIIPSGGLSPALMPVYWDHVILEGREVDVIKLLQIVDTDIERLYMLESIDSFFGRVAYVKTRKFDKPIQLHNLGEGLMRIFGLALTIIKTRNGFLLIDEFENGLHHDIQLLLWRFVFRLAKESNIQVFATTHSWDCVEAFQEAAAEDQNEEAMMIRLQRKRDGTGIVATPYDEESLKIVTRQGIEVR